MEISIKEKLILIANLPVEILMAGIVNSYQK